MIKIKTMAEHRKDLISTIFHKVAEVDRRNRTGSLRDTYRGEYNHERTSDDEQTIEKLLSWRDRLVNG